MYISIKQKLLIALFNLWRFVHCVDLSYDSPTFASIQEDSSLSDTKPVAPPRKLHKFAAHDEFQPLGPFTRQTWEAWKELGQSVNRPVSDISLIRKLFRIMNLCPSQAQIHEMLDLSRESRTHLQTNFTFGAFTFYAAEMKHYERTSRRNAYRRLSCGSPKISLRSSYDVFLGGACNPTRWRQELAMPTLKEAKVTYYNPQMEDWRPNLIRLEQQAKDNAKVLLFVHVKETRALASMVEVAERSALDNSNLVLAIEKQSDVVSNETLSESELREMHRARNYMQDIAEKHRVRVYSDIGDAVTSCIDIVKSKENPKLPPLDCKLGEKFIEARSAFQNHATDKKVSIEESHLAFRALEGKDIPKDLQMSAKTSMDESEYLQLIAEYRSRGKSSLPFSLSNLFHSYEKTTLPPTPNDVFICGPTGSIQWKTEIAQPMFEKAHIPIKMRDDEAKEHFFHTEIDQIAKSKVLLFVFPSDTWGAPEMIMASYYIAMKKKVVLCTQQVCENTPVNGESFTVSQAKDYNRCRLYLSDLAFRNKVPVLDNIKEAVEKAIELARV